MEEGLRTVMTVFEMPPTFLLNPIRNSQLAAAYSYFAPLQESGALRLTYQDEVLTVAILPSADNPTVKLAGTVRLAI